MHHSVPSTAHGLDLREYLGDIQDIEGSEQQKLEFLYCVTSMMAFCVRQGIDIGICGQLLEAFNECSTDNSTALPSSFEPDGGSIE